MALWKLLKMEISEGVGAGGSRSVSMTFPPIWLGDTASMHYPMGENQMQFPATIMSVLKQDLACAWKIRDEIQGGCQVNEHSVDDVAYDKASLAKMPGFLEKLSKRMAEGQRGRKVAAPFATEPYMNAPSGWLGWLRQVAQTHYETERPVFDQRYARCLEDNPNLLVEILGALNRPLPEPLLHRARESARAGAEAGKQPFPTTDHWGGPDLSSRGSLTYD